MGCGSTEPRLHLDSSHGSGAAAPIDAIPLFTTGGSSGPTSIAELQLSSAAALPRGSSLDENCISPQNSHFGKEGPIDRLYDQGPPSWCTGRTNHSEPIDQHLLDGVDGNDQSALSHLSLTPGPLSMAKSLLIYTGNEDAKGTFGYTDGSAVVTTSERSSTCAKLRPLEIISTAAGPSVDELQTILQRLREMDKQLRSQILQQQEAITRSILSEMSNTR